MAEFILLLIVLFIAGDIFMRYYLKKRKDKKIKEERASVLETSVNLDFSAEAKSLKRAEVSNPVARILCVDDEEVILDSFRKILVMDGYSVDTVENGKEALGLLRKHHYDFVFTDLKMPEMDGMEVTKSVKHLRPDIDVIIITGYATVETAVQCMQYGAMDYVQKPFTEDELLAMVKKFLIKRNDRVEKSLKPRVQITDAAQSEAVKSGEFAIPGGVFISEGHCWAGISEEGNANIGLDDFSRKVIGKIDGFEFPNLGMEINVGDTLFSVKQGKRTIPFSSPVSGKVAGVNKKLAENLGELAKSPYGKNHICKIDAENLDTELKELKIGKSAVEFYQHELDRYYSSMKNILKYIGKKDEEIPDEKVAAATLADIDDFHVEEITDKFFKRVK